MTNTFWLIWGAIFGLILGSFFNVLVVRDDRRKTILTGRSACPHCKHVLAWYDLIPLLSFLSTAGRCRYCRKSLSWQYPLMEVIAASLVTFSVWYGWIERGSWILAIGLSLSLLLLLTVSMIDIHNMSVPLDYVLVAGVIGVGSLLFTHQETWLDVCRGAVVGAGSIAVVLYGWQLLFGVKGMGEGDIAIAGVIGAMLRYPQILIGLMAAVFLGAIIGSLLISMQKKRFASAIPFGPFLFAGLLFSLIWGQAVLSWYILYP